MSSFIKYTPEIEKHIRDAYTSGELTVDQLATIYEVPSRSIIAKLSTLGLYKRKGYLSKTGLPPKKKEAYIDTIARVLDKPVEVIESLEKCNKNVLVLIEKALLELQAHRACETDSLKKQTAE